MALITCNECKKEISNTVKSCPNCGYQNIFQSSNPVVKGKKNKLYKYGIIFLCFFIFYKCVQSVSESAKDDKIELISKLKKEHCSIEWSKTDLSTREKIVKDFLDNSEELIKSIDSTKSLNMDATALLLNGVKYPGTIKIDGEITNYIILHGSDAEIIDLNKGKIVYSKNFTCENKLNMEVKSTFYLTLEYTAGCKLYKITDFNVE
jgi:predicted RNA-binding Zn-ribbon protein involved in translation (DUF1610 family)